MMQDTRSCGPSTPPSGCVGQSSGVPTQVDRLRFFDFASSSLSWRSWWSSGRYHEVGHAAVVFTPTSTTRPVERAGKRRTWMFTLHEADGPEPPTKAKDAGSLAIEGRSRPPWTWA